MARDRENDLKLIAMDWVPIHFWGQEIQKHTDECVEAVWVRVEEKEHCLDWDESQYSAGETYGKGVYLDGVYANDRLEYLRNAIVILVKAVDISLEEDAHAVARVKKITLIEGEEIQLAIHTDYNKEGSYATV